MWWRKFLLQDELRSSQGDARGKQGDPPRPSLFEVWTGGRSTAEFVELLCWLTVKDRADMPDATTLMDAFKARQDGDAKKWRATMQQLPVEKLAELIEAMQFLRFYDIVREWERKNDPPAKKPQQKRKPKPKTARADAAARTNVHAAADRASPETEAEKTLTDQGVHRGKLTPEQRAHALQMRSDGMNNADIARVFGVSRSTISRL